MTFSSNVSTGDIIKASHYNNLRKDIIDISDGHNHDGVNSKYFDITYNMMNIKIQTGQVTMSNGTSTKSIIFDTVFPSAPIVIFYPINAFAGVFEVTISFDSITANGFTLFKRNNATNDLNFAWLAIYTP